MIFSQIKPLGSDQELNQRNIRLCQRVQRPPTGLISFVSRYDFDRSTKNGIILLDNRFFIELSLSLDISDISTDRRKYTDEKYQNILTSPLWLQR